MDLLQGMKVFIQVAQRSSFAAAARALRMSPGAVTKTVASLEDHLGTRLFDRTTRRVGMTEAGHLYLERCQECLQTVDDADASVSALGKEARGTLRVNGRMVKLLWAELRFGWASGHGRTGQPAGTDG